MDEKKKLLIVSIVLVALIGLVLTIAIVGAKKDKELFLKFEEAYADESPTLVYIGRPTCGYCNLLEPSLQEMSERYEFDYIYFNIDDYSSSYLNKVFEKLNLTDIGTPYLTIVGGNKVIDTNNGYVDYDALFSFLQENEVINSEAVLPINYIGYDEYEELISSSTPQVIVVGQSTCSYCIQAKLGLNQITDEYGVEINYLNISYLTNDEGLEFQESLEYLSSSDWGTPLMFIAKDNEMVAYTNGYQGVSQYISFLEDQGVINE